MNWKKLKYIGLVTLASLSLAACGSTESANENQVDLNSLSLEEIEEKAKEEGAVNSVGMPDDWANWEETWADLNEKYGLEHSDTDMGSAEELATFEAEKENASAEIGDVGIAFGPYAVERDVVMPYKTSYWDDIPDWAKDDEGNWLLSYTGTMAFLDDTEAVDETPTSWKEVAEGDYKVTIGDVAGGNQDQFAVLAAAMANGGDETNIQPGLDYYRKLGEEGRLNTVGYNAGTLESGEHEVVPMWDFNALTMQDTLGSDRFEVVIPTDGTVTSGYTTILNKYTQRPHAAALAREYILSDEGQNNLARGHARPIRENVELDQDAKDALLPDEMYESARPVEDLQAWNDLLEQLGSLWQDNVITHLKN
ncbi:ABC transporter substrate-binding protein [Aerococcus sanguinicola]